MQFINHHVHGPKQEIGHIDLLSKFSYIEVPEKDADKVMRAGRQSAKAHDDDSRRGRDDWKQLMADSRNIKLRGEVPDFSEEGWARRRPTKK
jgi:ATP-dependent RNA helicase DeaD